MKKLLFVIPLAVVLLSLTIMFVGAGMGYEDPKLCVNGNWLLVDAAAPSAIQVYVPEGTRYGDQKAGGCKTPGLNVPLITKVVKERGEGNAMQVVVDSKQASTPIVKAMYSNDTQSKKNNGKTLTFTFRLSGKDD